MLSSFSYFDAFAIFYEIYFPPGEYYATSVFATSCGYSTEATLDTAKLVKTPTDEQVAGASAFYKLLEIRTRDLQRRPMG